MPVASRLFAAPLLLTLAGAACGASDGDVGEGTQNQVANDATIPLREVSGLALKDGRFVAVGDRTSTVVSFRLKDGAPDEVVEHKPLPKAGKKGSQYEGVAFDGAGNVIVLSEQGDVILLSDDCEREESSTELDWKSAAKLLDVDLADNSGGEGLVMLDGGHILVALEKKPAAIIEFGPRGSAPMGFAPGTRATEAFKPADKLVALKAWKVDDKHATDVSDLTIGPDGALWAISQESNTLLRFERVLRPDEDRATVKVHINLPAQIAGAEGLEFDGLRPVVARDRAARDKTNLYILDQVPSISEDPNAAR